MKDGAAELHVDHLQLTLTADTNANRIVLEALRNQSILLLRKEEYENYFKDSDEVEKIVFLVSLHAKGGDKEGKAKERIIGKIKPTRSCYEIEWDFMDIRDSSDDSKADFTHFCEI